MKINVPDYILKLKPYKPGKPIEELEREYGIKDSIKLASNENPQGPPESALEAMKNALKNAHRYPDGSGFYLTQKLATKNHVKPENIVLGNGSDDIIGLLTRAFLTPGDQALMPLPSFLMYEIMVNSAGAESVFVPLSGPEKSFSIDLDGIVRMINPKTRMIFLTNPNNPTGTVIRKDDFDSFCSKVPKDILLVIDEAYIEFARDENGLFGQDYIDQGRPVVVLRTFSKAYGLAGLRVGYGIMDRDIAQVLNRVRMPFNVNSIAQAGALAALDDEDYLEKSLAVIQRGLDYLYGELDGMGVTYFKTQSNFFLIDVKMSADEVFERLLREGVIVRSMTSYGFPEYIRVTVGLIEENKRFIMAFKKVVSL
ncbi:MAG: histidinol-phosphate transaminase [Proteobacteria bacterium]|nr:histidinol-phosphate transaminase [Pseudomonadota bacterium]